MKRLNLLLALSFCFLLITSCGNADDTAPINVNAKISINNPTPVEEEDTWVQSIIFLVTLEEPDANNPISVDYAISGGDQNGTGGTLTFPANTAMLTQTITVTINGDVIVQEDTPVTIILLNPSANASLTTDNIGSSSFVDDDVAGFTVTPQAITTVEGGGTQTFTVVLDAAPASDVILDVVSTDITEGAVSPNNITFTTSNYNVPRTVTITPINDSVNDGDVTYAITVSIDSDASNVFFNDLSSNTVNVTNENN